MWLIVCGCSSGPEPDQKNDGDGPSSADECDDLDLLTLYEDQDGDGYGATQRQRCEPGLGWVEQGGDCDDGDPTRHPGAPELCGESERDCDPSTSGVAELGSVGFGELQQALDAAEDGDTVIVCAGVHLEHDLHIDHDVTLMGETGDPADTILDAQAQGVLIRAETDELTLHGLTLRGGSDDSIVIGPGAGVRASGAVTVVDCRVEDNHAAVGTGGISAGRLTVSGSLFRGNESGSTHAAISAGVLDISDSTFEDNESWYAAVAGGGRVSVRDSVFLDNLGGGLLVMGLSALTLSGVTFDGNEGGYGGALTLFSESPATVTVTDTLFVGNVATEDGGAVYWQCGPDDTWTGGTFQDNISRNGGAMSILGGVHLPTQSITLRELVMEGNSAEERGGGLGVETWSNLTVVQIEDSRIVGNSADLGGGVGDSFWGAYGRLVLQDVLLEQNTATQGGGIHLDYMGAELYSCDLGSDTTDNTPDDLQIGGQPYGGYGEDTTLVCSPEGCL
jgi:predicted outer membrane repeat protein